MLPGLEQPEQASASKWMLTVERGMRSHIHPASVLSDCGHNSPSRIVSKSEMQRVIKSEYVVFN